MVARTSSTALGLTPSHGLDYLTTATTIWFIVTALGQWLFVVYIGAYYGGRFAAEGAIGFAGTHLANGYIEGDSLGNSALVFHILVAGLIIAAGQLQLLPNIRRTVPRLHRFSGGFYMIASVLVSIAGIYLTWSRERVIGSFLQDVGTTGGGILVLVFVPLALMYAIRGDFAAHRRWALRLFMVVSAVWFLRLLVYGWFVTTGGIGIDGKTFSGPTIQLFQFLQYLLPLAVLELYFAAQASSSLLFKRCTAGVIVLMSGLMSVGIFAISVFFWMPRVVGS